MEKINPIDEARRYVANAEGVIRKANYDPELKIYLDSKYVKMAGDTLWKGCLIALDAVLDVRKGTVVHPLKSTKRSRVNATENCWQPLRTGITSCTLPWVTTEPGVKTVCNSGFEYANDIIDHCAKLYPDVN